MIGIIMLIFIGKYYYELAKKFKKQGWLYVLMGIGIYYGSAFTFGLLIGLIDVIFGTSIINSNSEMAIGYLGIPVGLLVCWFVYKKLEKFWTHANGSMESNEDQIESFGSKEEDINFER